MDMWISCQSCEICSGAVKTADHSLIYGNLESQTLLIGSSRDFMRFTTLSCGHRIPDPEMIESLPNDVALTFTTRCYFESEADPMGIANCAIFTRSLTYAFKNFVMTKEAWNQLGLTEEFRDGETIITPIGQVYCVNDIFSVFDSISISNVVEFSASEKRSRKQILTRRA